MINEVITNILDKAVNGFILLDEDFNIVFFNSFIKESLRGRDIQNRNIFEAFPEIQSGRIQECIYRAKEKKDSSIITHSLNRNQFPLFSRRHKEQMKQNIYIHPIREGNVVKLILIQISDETVNASKETLLREKTLKEKTLNQALKEEIIKKTEFQKLLLSKKEEIEEANRVLVRLDSEKNEFLGMVAHDLRNPLSIIRAIAEDILVDSKDMKDLREGLGLIAQAASSMIRLVTDLLDSHTIESGKVVSKVERVNLIKLVHARVEIQKMQAYRKRIILETSLELSKEEYILDSRCFMQVLDNYLSNAIKFSGVDTLVRVHVFEREDKIFCEVSDQGPGLNPEDQKKIFQKFAKLTPRPTAGEKSNGLGLFISKKMAEFAGGNVWVSSSPGLGSCFGLSIPFLPEFRVKQDTPYHGEGRVLLIDDEEIIQKIFATQIRQIDHTIDVASDAQSAFQLMEKYNYDFIFIDRHLENETGESVLNKIQSMNSHKHTKYILCSGDVTPANRDFFISLGFDEAIPKDFHIETIRFILEDL